MPRMSLKAAVERWSGGAVELGKPPAQQSDLSTPLFGMRLRWHCSAFWTRVRELSFLHTDRRRDLSQLHIDAIDYCHRSGD
jgi:hypothetical protein